jgi:RNA polymerase sigma-70 factor, ECF subfamily
LTHARPRGSVPEMVTDHEQVDRELREHFERGELERTATLFLERYGQEILGFLLSRLRNATTSADVFSQFAEDFWKGLPGFSWRSSLRAWAYALARNAAYRHRQAPAQRQVHQTFGEESPFAQQVALHRTNTQLYMKSEVKSRMRELRERLTEEEQTLLILRVDRKLSWKELAVALSETDADAAELARKATNFRQRFQQVKHRLRALAVAEGLLPDQNGPGSR